MVESWPFIATNAATKDKVCRCTARYTTLSQLSKFSF